MRVRQSARSHKTRDMDKAAADATRWDRFRYRDGDIVIGSWAKSGTTWTQQIVAQLIFSGAENLPTLDIAPWIDLRAVPLDWVKTLDAQTHRRFMKTHLPAEALVFSSRAKYLYIGRDGRDVAWSWYNHLCSMTPAAFDRFNRTRGRVGPPLERPTVEVQEFFHDWLDNDARSAWPYWSNIQSWWKVRHAPNVLLLHFNDLKADLPGEIRRIAAFLDIDIDESRWPAIVEHCTFDYMKKHADTLSAVFKHVFEGGLKRFIFKGTNNRWRDMLSAGEIQKYEDTAAGNLTPECARWLATGSR